MKNSRKVNMDGIQEHTVDNNTDTPLLTLFLHELNIARRQLALYPPDHPNILSSVDKTLKILDNLFHSGNTITIGITPDALLFEDLWLDRDDPANRDFARYFFTLGIASVSFSNGLNGPELVRFNQLLRSDRETIEQFGGFQQLLEQQRIDHVSVIPVDYEAFQSGKEMAGRKEALWETFLHGLQNGILDFGSGANALNIEDVAELLNRKFTGTGEGEQRVQYVRSLEHFFEQHIRRDGFSQVNTETDRTLNSLLTHLRPDAQQQLFESIFHVLDRNPEAGPGLLQKIPPALLQAVLVDKTRHSLNISPRLFALATSLARQAADPAYNHNISAGAAPMSRDMIRARLDVLFHEEQQDLYMPATYQAALDETLKKNIGGSIPAEEKENLRSQLERQSVEDNFLEILIDMLQRPLDGETEAAAQRNLLSLSRFFLDTGNFDGLREVYQNWFDYLYSENTETGIFAEKVLANHTQPSFMAEVLDSFDLWEEEKHPRIRAYITTVGDAYSDQIIERLGLAPSWPERQRWITLLEQIGDDAQDKIIRALDDDRWYLIRNLLSVLGRQPDPKTIKILQRFRTHQHPKVRIEALRILFFCNPATANRQLLDEIRSDDPEARLGAVQIADLSNDAQILRQLHKQLENEPGDDAETELLTELVRTLKRIGHRESLPVFRRVLKKQGLLTSRRLKKVQHEVILNLVDFPDPAARKLLKEFSGGRYRQQIKQAQEKHS